MPHISKKKISKQAASHLEKHLTSFVIELSQQKRHQVFNELFTKTERMMAAKRLAIIYLIAQNTPTLKISELFQVSPSTVARFEHAVENGSFRQTTEWLKRSRQSKDFFSFLLDMLTPSFNPKARSFNKIVRDM